MIQKRHNKSRKNVVQVTTKWKATVQISLLFMGAVFITYGVTRGEAGVVLSKAVKICLECVGIG